MFPIHVCSVSSVPVSTVVRRTPSAVLSLALNQPFVRELLHWRTSHPIDYDGSVLSWRGMGSDGFTDGPGPGALAKDVKLADDSFLLRWHV